MIFDFSIPLPVHLPLTFPPLPPTCSSAITSQPHLRSDFLVLEGINLFWPSLPWNLLTSVQANMAGTFPWLVSWFSSAHGCFVRSCYYAWDNYSWCLLMKWEFHTTPPAVFSTSIARYTYAACLLLVIHPAENVPIKVITTHLFLAVSVFEPN